MIADALLAAAENPDLVTPGVWGFVITFGVAVVVVLLIMDMVRRIRRVRYRDDIARKLDAEQRGTDRDDTRPDHEHRDANDQGDRPGPDRAQDQHDAHRAP